jgi:hypothetical protein
MYRFQQGRLLAVAMALLSSLGISVGWGDLAVSQVVCAKTPILDEFGKKLVGTDATAELFGIPVVEGDLVQILQATDGVIHPPDTNGKPDPRNVVLATTRIGRGIVPDSTQPGVFSAVLSPRPGGNSKIFARVFNAGTLDDASFYGQSQLFTVKSFQNEVFVVQVSKTALPLDGSDPDGDGLNNSWEKSLGSNPNAGDTDGDGYTDGEEALAGTDLVDPESRFEILSIIPADGGQVKVRFRSAADRQYDIEQACASDGDAISYECVGSASGDGQTQEVLVPLAAIGEHGWLRLRVRGGGPAGP